VLHSSIATKRASESGRILHYENKRVSALRFDELVKGVDDDMERAVGE
jgi:hypothetical protein